MTSGVCVITELRQLLTELVRDVWTNCKDILSAALSAAGPEAANGLQA
jgi:hypothetical protein